MKIFELLKSKGYKSKDIISRFKNNQIKINGKLIDKDFEVNISEIISIEDFIIDLINQNKIYYYQLKIIGIDNIIDSNINTNLKNILKENLVLRISKKELFIIKIKK